MIEQAPPAANGLRLARALTSSLESQDEELVFRPPICHTLCNIGLLSLPSGRGQRIAMGLSSSPFAVRDTGHSPALHSTVSCRVPLPKVLH